MATNPAISLPTGWEAYNPQQKVDYFNQQGIGAQTLTQYGVPQSDIDYMNTLGYKGGAAPPPMLSAGPSAAEQAVFNAYAGIGRSGVGSNTANIDPEGFNYWVNQVSSGAIKPEELQSKFGTAVSNYIAEKPTDAVTQYVQNVASGAVTPQVQSAGYQYATQPGGIGAGTYNQNIRNYVDNLISQTPQGTGIAPQLLSAAKEYGVSLEDIKKALPAETYQRFASDFGNVVSSGIANIISDKNVTLSEAADALKAIKDLGLTPAQVSQFAGSNVKFVESLQPAVDTGLTSLISGWTSDKNINTEEAKNLLGLAQKYGLTDADLAKYTGGAYTEQQVGEYLAPVRGFGTAVKPLLDDRNATPDAIRAKITELSSNPLVAELYAPQLQALTSALDTAGDKWSTGAARLTAKSGQNVLAAENLYQQLAAMRNTVKENLTGGKEFWSGEGYGSLDENMQGFTQRLLEKGVTDLRQLDVQTTPVMSTGTFVRSGGQWMQQVNVPAMFGEVGDTETQMRPVPDPELLQQLNQYGATTEPVKLEYQTGETRYNLVNKETGEVLGTSDDPTFRMGYTTKGEGMVNWNLKMVPQTNPETGEASYVAVPVQQYESTSDMGSIAPLLAVAQFVPGVAPFAMAANAALAASQGNWLGALASGLGALPGVSAALGNTLGASTIGTIKDVATGLRVANSVSNGDYLGALTATGNLVGAGGWTVPGTEGMVGADGLQLGELSKGIAALGALAQGQVLPGLLAGADLAGVKDIMGTGIAPKDVAATANVIQAVQSKNPYSLINTVGRTAQAYGKLPKMASGGLASLVG